MKSLQESRTQRNCARNCLEPLADQQLAGVVMWIPAGAIYLAVALALIVDWIGLAEREEVALRRGP